VFDIAARGLDLLTNADGSPLLVWAGAAWKEVTGMASALNLKIAIRHYPEDGHFNVSDIDVGPLLGGLTEEPGRLARGVTEDGVIRIQVERTHEWELLLGVVISGSAVFGKAVLETLGKRLGNWMADQVEKRLKNKDLEIRGDDGRSTRVDPDNLPGTRALYTDLLEKAAERGGTVVILFPW